jgi:hypothetical protein
MVSKFQAALPLVSEFQDLKQRSGETARRAIEQQLAAIEQHRRCAYIRRYPSDPWEVIAGFAAYRLS